MLEVEYKKDMQKNYLIIKQATTTKKSYEMKMLINNQIQGLLNMELRTIDGNEEYYYNITNKQTMSILFQKQTLKEKQIKTILLEIINTLKRGKEYLLLEQNFILSPEYVYLDLEQLKPELIYFSNYKKSIREQLLQLIEYMMDKVDYEDKKAVFLIYGIYKISREEDITFEKLLKFLEEKDELEEELKRKEKLEQEIWEEEEKVIDMEVPVESEEERKKYPFWVFLACGISVFLALAIIIVIVRFEFVFDKVTGQLLIERMIAVLGIVGALEAFVLLKVLDEKHKIAYIDKRIDYIKPVEEKRKLENSTWKEKEKDILFTSQEKEEIYDNKNKKIEMLKTEKQDMESKTMLFAEREMERETILLAKKEEDEQETVLLAKKEEYVLIPTKLEQYVPILIVEFPFFIGTLKTKVDCVINNRAISRFHAKLEREKDHFYLTDLNSTNGTFLNGIRLTANVRKEIVIGDYITFADAMYQFQKQ